MMPKCVNNEHKVHQNKANQPKNEANSNGSLASERKQRSLANLRPFKKGQSGNPSGRPKSLDQLRARAQEIAHQRTSSELTKSDDILQDWANSKDVRKQELFMWYAYGKPPDKIESTIDDKRTLKLYWPHERQDLVTSNGSSSRNN